jgi:hypothetical protein
LTLPAHFPANGDCDSLWIAQNVRIGKAQNAITFAREPPVARSIEFHPQVVRDAVDLDHQLQFAAQKVGEELAHLHLATELRPGLRAREVSPQKPLGRRGLFAQLASAFFVAGLPSGHCGRLAHP